MACCKVSLKIRICFELELWPGRLIDAHAPLHLFTELIIALKAAKEEEEILLNSVALVYFDSTS